MTCAASVRRSARRHPVACELVLATLVAVAGVAPVLLGVAVDGREASWAEAGAAALAAVLVLGRGRAPIPVLAVTLALQAVVLLQTPARTPVMSLTALIVLYTVVSRGTQRTAIAATIVTGAVLYATAAAVTGSFTDPRSYGVLAWTGMAAAIGATVRTWRDYVDAVEERAARAEATREEEARRRVAEERLHIARELHDVIAHNIALINVQAGVARHMLHSRPEASEVALDHVLDAGRGVLDELSSLLYVLRAGRSEETPHEPPPGLSRLDRLVESFTAATSLPVRREACGEPRPLPAATDLAAYRIIQEGLTNVHKHGDRTGATLRLTYAPQALEIEILNAARILDRGSAAGGHGLIGMSERAHAVGGTLDAAPGPDGTFRLTARLPLPRHPGTDHGQADRVPEPAR